MVEEARARLCVWAVIEDINAGVSDEKIIQKLQNSDPIVLQPESPGNYAPSHHSLDSFTGFYSKMMLIQSSRMIRASHPYPTPNAA